MLIRYRAFSKNRHRAFWASFTSGTLSGTFILIAAAWSRGNDAAAVALEAVIVLPILALVAAGLAWFVSSLGPGEKRNKHEA